MTTTAAVTNRESMRDTISQRLSDAERR